MSILDPSRVTYENPGLSNKELNLLNRKDVWHKFIVYNGALYDKSLVLDSLIAACEPELLLPYMCKNETGGKLTFIAKCSGQTIKKLVMQGLRLQLQMKEEIKLDIILGFLTIKDVKYTPQIIITNTLLKRYNFLKKTLDLDNFQNDEGLGLLHCPIMFPQVLDTVLHFAKTSRLNHVNNRDLKLPVRKLSLRNNGIRFLHLSEKYFTVTLTCVDLRNNFLTDIIQLKYFYDFKITELWLDGNPLCDKYTKTEDYVHAMKGAFPHLQVLDGVTISINKKYIPNIQPCHLADGSQMNLIKQFISHFFTLYDQDDRIVLNGLYDDRALFSMTIGMLTNHNHKQVTKDFVKNRNLLKFVDYSKCHEFLLLGPEKIIAALRQQPPTIHNIKILHIDLLYCTYNYFAISVQGYFTYKDIGIFPMYFCRTFVVTAKEDNEYRIANDQYHIASAPNELRNLRFESKALPFMPTSLSISEKNQLIQFLHKLSNMNGTYCMKFLDEAQWDIRLAISNFMKAYTVNNIAPDAFYNYYTGECI